MNTKLIGNPAQVRKLTAGALRLQAAKISNRTVCSFVTRADSPAISESVLCKEDSNGSFAKIHSIPSVVYRDFPLPGNVGVGLMPSAGAIEIANDVSAAETRKAEAESPLKLEKLKRALNGFQLSVHACPTLLRGEFVDLFPSEEITNGPLSVVTFSHKTKNDMKFWTPEAEKERLAVYNDLVSAAVQSVNLLNGLGYWADFIDPYSGKPYYTSTSSDALTEADDRMSHFDFEIKDMVCCKVIMHREFGSNVIIGVLFTNAPYHAEPLRVLAGH